MLALFFNASAKLKTSGKEFENLIKLGETFGKKDDLSAKDYQAELDENKLPELANVIARMKAFKAADTSLMNPAIYNRPQGDDLVRWTVINQVARNSNSSNSKVNAEDIGKAVINATTFKEIDFVILFYIDYKNALEELFKETDLSAYNFNMATMGLKGEQEKAAFYLISLNAYIPKMVHLVEIPDYESMLGYFAKLPKYNGKAYNLYKSFSYEDFKVKILDDKSFNKSYLDNAFLLQMLHYFAIEDKESKSEAKNFYKASLISNSELMKFSVLKKEIKRLQKSLND